MEQIEAGMSVMTLKKQTYRVIAVINQGQELLVRAHEPETADIEIIPVTTVVQVTEQNSTGDAAVALDTVTVVGERYVDDIVATLTTLRVGMAVLLQRESGNQYDDNAISVIIPIILTESCLLINLYEACSNRVRASTY
ncbi:DNA-binding protein [Lactiplantibacillus plantarum]|nr:DNA-binding protein [Lactiplantibacillus plantarum]